MRRRHDILMDGERPLGECWNFDTENCETFGNAGLGKIRPPRSFAPDPITRDVMAVIERRFPSGEL